MAQFENMRLCGGTFLVLVLEARSATRAADSKNGRSSDKINMPELLEKFILTVNPHFIRPAGNSFNIFTSNYKNCNTQDCRAAELTKEIYISQFDDKIKNHYPEYLKTFHTLLDECIDLTNKGCWLVAALIDLIEADPTILNDTPFYVLPDGQTVRKDYLRKIESISIPAFVLGVWHYIVTKITDNTVGKKTLNLLLKQEGENHAQRKFRSKNGIDTCRDIKTFIPVLESTIADCSPTEKQPDIDPIQNSSPPQKVSDYFPWFTDVMYKSTVCDKYTREDPCMLYTIINLRDAPRSLHAGA